MLLFNIRLNLFAVLLKIFDLTDILHCEYDFCPEIFILEFIISVDGSFEILVLTELVPVLCELIFNHWRVKFIKPSNQ